MATVSRSGPLERGRDPGGPGRVKVGERVERPPGAVEVARHQAARVVSQQGIEARMDLPGKMVGGHRDQSRAATPAPACGCSASRP